jgi:hypothetical protein
MPDKPDSLDATIDALLNIGDVTEMQDLLRQAPSLLSERGLDRIRQRAAAAHAAGQKSLYELLDALRAVVTQVQLQEGSCPSTQVVDAVDALLKARTWDAARDVVQSHPELTTDEADARLGELLAQAEATGDGDPAFLEENLALLHRCREVGLEAAFEEKIRLMEALYDFVEAPTWDDAGKLLEAHPELLAEDVDRILAHMAEDARADRSKDAAVFLEENRALLARAREVGITQAFEEVAAAPLGDMMAKLDTFLDAPTWIETRLALETYPELLGDEADAMLADLIEAARQERDEPGAEFFAGRRHLLRLVREKGLEEAFGGFGPDNGDGA